MATIKADEIAKIIREQIENYQQVMAVEEVGSVISVGDGIARIHGLDKAMAGEMLSFPHDVVGIALNLEEDQVGAVLLGDYTKIEEGDTVQQAPAPSRGLFRSSCSSLIAMPFAIAPPA